MATMLIRVLGWCVFLTGIAAAVIGVFALMVELIVGGLIAALTSGLMLLGLRAQRLGRYDSAEDVRPG